MAQAHLVHIRESFRSGRAEIVAGLRSTQSAQGAVHLEQLRWAAKCDNAEAWREDGARSTGEWLARELGISQWKAHRMVNSGHALESLPYISACLGNGSLSLDKTLELTRFATPETEKKLVRWARRVTPGGIRDRADKLVAKKLEDVKDVYEGRSVSWMHTLDGATLCLEASLPTELGAVLTAAIDRVADTLPDMPPDENKLPLDRDYTIYQRRADALMMLATARLTEDHEPDIATVVVTAPLAVLQGGAGCNAVDHDLEGKRSPGNGDNLVGRHAELAQGPSLHSATAQRLACDCRLELTATDGSGRTVGIGRASRIVPRWLRRQLLRRDDHTCRFPGCGARKFLHAHHVIHWAHGGPTNLDNLLCLCSTHHTLVHEFGWGVTLSRSGSVTWSRPGGRAFDPGLRLPTPDEIDRAALPDPPRAVEVRRFSRLFGIAAVI